MRHRGRVDEVDSRDPTRKRVQEHQRLLTLAHVRVNVSEGRSFGHADDADPENLLDVYHEVVAKF